jgi:hypothetical protein
MLKKTFCQFQIKNKTHKMTIIKKKYKQTKLLK